MADTLTVALRVAEEAIEEAISKAEEFSDSLVRNLSLCLSVCLSVYGLINLSAIGSPTLISVSVGGSPGSWLKRLHASL